MFTSLHTFASRIRHRPALRALEPVFRGIEPLWNWVMGRAMSRHGLEARINNDVFRLSYAFAARYQKQRVYEPDIYLPYAASIRVGMTVFDIGAHVGFFTLAAAQRVGPSGRVVAFEPSPDTLRVLRHHVTLNSWDDRVVVEPSVVSDAVGTTVFYTYGDSMAASLSRTNVEQLNAQHPDHATPVEVPTITLDRYCRDRGHRPHVLKIDAEGAELRVLKGAEQLLRESIDLIVWCEVHPLQMQGLGDGVEDLGAFLARLDYVLEPIAPPGHHGIYASRIVRRAPAIV